MKLWGLSVHYLGMRMNWLNCIFGRINLPQRPIMALIPSHYGSAA